MAAISGVLGKDSSEWRALVWGAMEYTPNEAQVPFLADFINGARVQLLCGGERAGKSMTAAAALLLDMGPRGAVFSKCKERRFWIVGPDYRQTRPEFLYVYNALNKLGYVESASMPENDNQPWNMTTKWKTILQTRSSGKEEKLASYTVHGVLMSEASQQNRAVLDKMLGRTSETRGWIMMVGTLEDSYPWYAELVDEWEDGDPQFGRSYTLPAWSNTAIYPGGYDDPEMKRLRAMLPIDYFLERYAARPRRSKSLVIPDFDPAVHIKKVKVEEDVPVQLAIDPGTHCYAVLFLQTIGEYTYVIDEIYRRNAVVNDIIRECKAHALWPFVLRNADAYHGSIDFAGRQRPANDSQVDIWRASGIRLFSEYRRITDSILVVRQRLRPNHVLGHPMVYFSDQLEPGTFNNQPKGILGEFSLWKWPRVRPSANEREEPIDRYNDAIKALAYYLLWRHGLEKDKQKTSFGSTRPEGWSPKQPVTPRRRLQRTRRMAGGR